MNPTELLRTDRRTLVSALSTLLVVALVVPFAVYAVPGLVGADASYVVLSGSMEPAIGVGDVVLVDAVDPGTLAVGDVITYTGGAEIPTTHRIVGVTDGEAGLAFETMGDANEGPDPGTVAAEQVIGTVVYTLPYIGYVVQFAGTTYGFVGLAVLPLVLLAALEARAFRERRNDTVETDGNVTDEAAGDPDAPAAQSDPASERGPTGDADGLTLSEEALTLGFAAFAAFAAYAAYVAFVLRTTWSFTAVAASLGVLVLLAAVRLDLFSTSEPAAVSTDGGTEGRVVEGEFHVTGGQPLVGVAAAADLRSMAADDDRWVVRDGDVEYLFGDGVVFCADVPSSGGERDAE